MHFATVDVERKMKVFESPVGMLFTASSCDRSGAVLLSNFVIVCTLIRYHSASPTSLRNYISHKDK